MANRERGEVEITIGGRVYTLAMGLKAMTSAEQALSTPDKRVTFQEILEAADKGSMTHLEVLIWSVFQRRHKDVKLDDIEDIVADAGGLSAFTVTLQALATAAAPDPRDLEALGVKADPPVAQVVPVRKAGTGGRSTSRAVAQA